VKQALPQTSSGEAIELKTWLQQKYTERCKRNPMYSLRAFARSLDLHSASVSQLLSGKRRASPKLIRRLCEKLGAHPLEKEALLKFSERPWHRTVETQALRQSSYRQLTLDVFEVVSEWYHAAIMDLTFVEGFESSPAWIAKSLGITAMEARAAIDRLMRLNLLTGENGRLQKTEAFLTNYEEGITAPALKNFQRQILEKALAAIDSVPQEEKDITSMTMSIDVEKLSQAKKLIKKFRRDLCAFLETGKRTRVYNLGIQLYPVSKNLKKNGGTS